MCVGVYDWDMGGQWVGRCSGCVWVCMSGTWEASGSVGEVYNVILLSQSATIRTCSASLCDCLSVPPSFMSFQLPAARDVAAGGAGAGGVPSVHDRPQGAAAGRPPRAHLHVRHPLHESPCTHRHAPLHGQGNGRTGTHTCYLFFFCFFFY